MAGGEQSQDNFGFTLTGPRDRPYVGYISSVDKTTVTDNAYVRGSKNVYRKTSGTIAVRDGLKRRGEADGTLAGVKSAFVWNTSIAQTRVLRVANNKLQVESNIADGSTYVWYDLQDATGYDDYVFDTWWNDSGQRDQLLFVRGDENLYYWNGGIGVIASTTSNTITLTEDALESGFFFSAGTVLINGNEYSYSGLGFAGNVVYNNFAEVTGQTVTTTDWAAQLFTTGASSTQISTVRVQFETAAPQASTGIFVASIYTDNAGEPGTLLGSATGSVGGAWSGKPEIDFTFASLSSSPNTNYHLVVRQQTSLVGVTVNTGNTPATGTKASIDSGVTWTDVDGYMWALITENTITGATFTGVDPDPTGEANGSIVLDSVYNAPTTPAEGFQNDFIKVINNQVYVGSYTSRLIYVSSDDDFADFTTTTTEPGNPELFTLDSLAKGIGVKDGLAHIFGGTQDLYIVSYSTLQIAENLLHRETSVAKKTMASLEAPINHNFITNVGDDLIWLSQDQEVKVYGTFRNLNTPVFPILSLPIKEELQQIDFTGGHITAIGEYIYITAPNEGVVWLHQTLTLVSVDGNVNSDRVWHSPFIWNLSRIVEINGVQIGFSNANPQEYQMWDTLQWHDDSPSDDPLPYTCVLAMAYRQRPNRTKLLSGDKAYYEGYMSPGSTVQSAVVLDYQGSTGVLVSTLNSSTSPAIFFTGNLGISLGDSSLGDNPLGEGVSDILDDQEALPKFRVITDVSLKDSFEYQLRVFSSEADSRWEILSLGLDQAEVENDPVWLRKAN